MATMFSDCKYNCHKKCSEHVAKDCSGSDINHDLFLGDNENQGNSARSLINAGSNDVHDLL